MLCDNVVMIHVSDQERSVAGHVQVAVISTAPPPDAGGVVRIWRLNAGAVGGMSDSAVTHDCLQARIEEDGK